MGTIQVLWMCNYIICCAYISKHIVSNLYHMRIYLGHPGDHTCCDISAHFQTLVFPLLSWGLRRLAWRCIFSDLNERNFGRWVGLSLKLEKLYLFKCFSRSLTTGLNKNGRVIYGLTHLWTSRISTLQKSITFAHFCCIRLCLICFKKMPQELYLLSKLIQDQCVPFNDVKRLCFGFDMRLSREWPRDFMRSLPDSMFTAFRCFTGECATWLQIVNRGKWNEVEQS